MSKYDGEDNILAFHICDKTIRLPYHTFMSRIIAFKNEMYEKGMPISFNVFPSHFHDWDYVCVIFDKKGQVFI